jgi:hypothetical protein
MVLARSMSGTITISIEAPVDLQLKFGVRMNLVRHGNFFSESSSQKTSFAHLKSDQNVERLFSISPFLVQSFEIVQISIDST